MPERQITVFLADDNLRESVRALINLVPDLVVVGAAADYDGLAAGAEAAAAHKVVTDIRLPPSFQREVIDAAKEVRKRPPAPAWSTRGHRSATCRRRRRSSSSSSPRGRR